jgi:2-polyprenyl-3-methyl-5-hydroxy-6-metoxy-1,4-benzoquinol methylase
VRDEELTAAIREVQERVRSQHAKGAPGSNGLMAADLMPLVHARDAAEAKVAAIGTVNQRRPGFKNAIIQKVKRLVARALDWHVREQVEFNRGVMGCMQATIEALTEVNRALAHVAAEAHQYDRLGREMQQLEASFAAKAQEFNDIRIHWAEWRVGFEDRRAAAEIHMLRTISEQQGSFQYRVAQIEQSFRDALDRNTVEVQKRLWKDLEHIRGEYEKLIHTELKVIRQKALAQSVLASSTASAPMSAAPIAIDWLRFAETFRGSQERIREQQQKYVARFAGADGEVLDLGCGRGEFLELARNAKLAARGIDQSDECVAICRSKDLRAERADLFQYLDSLADGQLGGIYCSQVVEHLEPARLPDLVRLLAQKVKRGGLLAIETPNPECLAIFATHFYLDPTHTRPVPAALLRFYLEEAGFGNIDVERLAPASEEMPALMELPTAVRDLFFGGLDYAIFARRV